SVYAVDLRKQLGGGLNSKWTARRILRIAMLQSAIQPTGLVLIPIGMVVGLPFASIYGFYQNFTALAGVEEAPLGALIGRSRSYAMLWMRQSWLVLLIQTGFALFVAANIAITMFVLPRLLQMLLGVETVFTKSGLNLLNSTFFAVCLGFTYLCADPVM